MNAPGQSLKLVANARMPSQRAQSLQVAQMAGAFARQGLQTTLVHALRRDTPALQDAQALWDHYGLPRGPRPQIEGIGNLDLIDLCPRALQYLPARLQELTFARNAAGHVRGAADAWILCRELECALLLARRGQRSVFLELHRVPGGRTRRRWLLEACAGISGVIAISGGVRDDLLALGVAPACITVEHDGFEVERFQSLPERRAARRELGLEADAPLVVYSGGLLAWKGVEILIEAARLLPEVRFVIAGGMDADVRDLSKRASDLTNVRFDGFQSPERVPVYLAAAELGVVPNRSRPPISARYTSPLKIFEAMAAGLPLVVSDLFSMRDVLGSDEAVFVEPDSPRALAAGIQELLDDDSVRARLAKGMRARAPECSWDARAERLLSWMSLRSQSSTGTHPQSLAE